MLSAEDPSTPNSTTGSESTTDDEHDVSHIEKLLPNGDFYTGQWSNDLPNGTGKYLWTDGCMYEGEWQDGKPMGKGKFLWPSGATYEGDLKNGFMDGEGTYTGTCGATYHGSWSMNLKQGHGKKSYANGDHYEGEWLAGQQDGYGRYIWKNGNEYVGHWKAGVIHGRGTLSWANGNKYDGGWEDGLPRGNGSFRWADGSLYIGFWSKEGTGVNQKGVYYPAPTASPTARNPNEVFASDLIDCKVSPGETVYILPSQKILNWAETETEFLQKQAIWKTCKVLEVLQPWRRSSADAVVPTGGTPTRRFNGHIFTNTLSGMERFCMWDSNGDGGSDNVNGVGEEGFETMRYQPTPLHLMKWPKESKKQGETISKGHKNYDLMLNLQLGIRHAVGKHGPPSTLDLKSSAFDPKEKVWTKFPPEGSKHTPPHQSCDFKWKDYCPLVFRTLRKLFKVDPGDYMLSICGSDALRELSSPGKSGSFFYLTNDDRYMIKTVKKSEVKVLLRMLPAYYNHVRAFENTLVTKFFGLHCVKLTGAAQKKVRFVIMGNLFCTEYVIHRRFDLKGSSLGRTTNKPESEIDENTTLKDLDLSFIFRLQRAWFQEFCRQVDRDCDFLEQERIMDYSLLVGIHFRESSASEEAVKTEDNVMRTPRLLREDGMHLLCDPKRLATVRLGINLPARVEQVVRRSSDSESTLIGEPTGEFFDVILFFGIIDILQDYDISKKLEHAYKSIQYDATSISAVDPKQYAKRFKDFIFKVYTEDNNSSLM
ncbi:uncharacterized protein A4U43_C02F18570 [Asparagus officinalis]|uniref:Phosphatidylinositol 4-phosphate 5-kinase n=1 Tax=Asparagus officinalis TaxID=4686 RepID=A0A5P1FN74_ASPOF|nr:phosphatidylinositol 4-phosphate 5-kinase 6-like [Asparagus officinalis]XP_020254574.1 phosphatidylinositol 4-phosphate 5-kinase 6-like [Asparagus officinalis]ONK78419.1 uncharacterized protein A4U43_C02F18570 [Asparagus officinalis]